MSWSGFHSMRGRSAPALAKSLSLPLKPPKEWHSQVSPQRLDSMRLGAFPPEPASWSFREGSWGTPQQLQNYMLSGWIKQIVQKHFNLAYSTTLCSDDISAKLNTFQRLYFNSDKTLPSPLFLTDVTDKQMIPLEYLTHSDYCWGLHLNTCHQDWFLFRNNRERRKLA